MEKVVFRKMTAPAIPVYSNVEPVIKIKIRLLTSPNTVPLQRVSTMRIIKKIYNNMPSAS